jgi:uncharacterized repeat protein (TIGR03803 family)
LILFTSSLRAQTFTALYTFTGGTDGGNPDAVLVQGRDGNLYGTTLQGGTGTCAGYTGCGSVFKISPSGKLTTLHTFTGADGAQPHGVVLATDGNYYGAATNGGSFGFGVIFRLTPGGTFTVLHHFTDGPDGRHPSNQLLEATDGNLYGFSAAGLYRFTQLGSVTTIYTFSPSQITDIAAALIQGTDGSLYGTIPFGNTGIGYKCGSIIKFDLEGLILSQHDFGCWISQNTGNFPVSSVIQGADGNIYGTNADGGTWGVGTVFKLDQHTGILTLLHTFDPNPASPAAGLVRATDGNFYGVTEYGGTDYTGVVYQLTSDGVYTTLVSFPDYGEDVPNVSLLQHTNGKFYSSMLLVAYPPSPGEIYSFENSLGPFVAFVRSQGKIGATAQVLGQGFTGTTSVTFNGLPAANFSVVSDTYLTAVVPSGATTGPLVVTTPSRTLTSNKDFRISH